MISQTIILGRLGADPETKEISGNTVANFSVATTDKWTDKNTGEKKEETQWHKCQAWGPIAKNIGQHLSKGSLVYLEGKNKTRKWTDKDGNDRYITEIDVKKVQFLDGKKEDKPVNYADPKHLNSQSEITF